MPKKIDINGQRFTHLFVLQPIDDGRWLCVCDCGTFVTSTCGSLRAGYRKSCGCYKHSLASEMVTKRNTTHGLSGSPTYQAWKGMHQRCNNKNRPDYKDYGGRGLKVCPEWSSYSRFYSDMGQRPSPKLSIERRDNDKGYSKSNCYWGTPEQQANNKRSNIKITMSGKTKTLAQWCNHLGLPYDTIHGRITDRNWNPEKALTEAIKPSKRRNK